MSLGNSQKQRLADNEKLFRTSNEKVVNGLFRLNEMAIEDNPMLGAETIDTLLHFYCECSDVGCRERIKILPSVYADIHKDRLAFIIEPGHQQTAIEEVIKTFKRFIVVRKIIPPSSDQ